MFLQTLQSEWLYRNERNGRKLENEKKEQVVIKPLFNFFYFFIFFMWCRDFFPDFKANNLFKQKNKILSAVSRWNCNSLSQ